MSRSAPWVQEHRLLVFFGLAFLVGWGPWPFAAAGLLPPEISFFPFGPLVAALVVIALTDGRRGSRRARGSRGR